jgi:peptidoglycan/xylan/chitin deacetylase (PgdA/CDA1 family)
MRIAAALVISALGFAGARAAECGPDALGTSRVAQVGTQGGLMVGLKTYDKTIPLADHEVILTFDDGPDPTFTPMVLKALADQCVRATFFVIGRKAEQTPELVWREVQEGHTVAHHTFTHPQPTLGYMTPAQARADILKGMAADEHAGYGVNFPPGEPKDLADIKLHAPFFRFPGFADTADLRGWFAQNNVGIFGVDLWASDWVKMTPQAELNLIMSRLEKPKRGMILFHDIHPWTAAMLPDFLRELKKRGYHVVHMVAGPGTGPTANAPSGWFSETERVTNAIMPKARSVAGSPTTGPIPVKPAPTE